MINGRLEEPFIRHANGVNDLKWLSPIDVKAELTKKFYDEINFEEIENYCKSKLPVKKYISLRKEDYKQLVQQFFEETPGFELYPAFVDPYSTPPKDILKDLILELMMNCILSLDNVLPGRNGDAKKWAFVQNMISHKLLRWIPMKKRPVQHMPATSYTYIPSMETSLLGVVNEKFN